MKDCDYVLECVPLCARDVCSREQPSGLRPQSLRTLEGRNLGIPHEYEQIEYY